MPFKRAPRPLVWYRRRCSPSPRCPWALTGATSRAPTLHTNPHIQFQEELLAHSARERGPVTRQPADRHRGRLRFGIRDYILRAGSPLVLPHPCPQTSARAAAQGSFNHAQTLHALPFQESCSSVSLFSIFRRRVTFSSFHLRRWMRFTKPAQAPCWPKLDTRSQRAASQP